MSEIRYYSLYLAGLIIAVFLLLQNLLGLDLAWQVGQVEIQFFTSMIAHSGVPHLLGNLFSLVLFGLILEGTLGSSRMFWILFLAAIAGNLAAIGSYNSVLGLSGGIYGLIGALTVLRPTMVIWLSGLPIPMVLAGVAYALLGIMGALAPADNTGHLAHLAGLAVGILAGMKYRIPRPKTPSSLSSHQKRALDQQLDMYEQRYLR